MCVKTADRLSRHDVSMGDQKGDVVKKILPIVIAVTGLAGGVAAGAVLKPAPEAPMESAEHEADGHATDEHGAAVAGKDDHGGGHDAGHAPSPKKSHKTAKKDDHGDGHGGYAESDTAYVGLQKPFFAPITRARGKRALVRLDLHLEVEPGMEDIVHLHEPKLRDGFLRSVLAFSQAGGFSTMGEGDGFDMLRDDLLTTARAVLGPKVHNVLIGEILSRT